MRFKIFSILLLTTLLISCNSGDKLTHSERNAILSDPMLFHDALENLTDILVHDILSPPVASRIYSYPCIAAYETLCGSSSSHRSMAGQLDGLDALPMPSDTSNLSYELASLFAFFKTSQALTFSEKMTEDYRDNLVHTLDSLGISEDCIAKSQKYGESVADKIIAWSNKDNYKESRSSPKFNITDEPGEWKPTPPSYMEAIEPDWRNIRTMVIRDLDQFQPAPPPPFDMNKGSAFRKLTDEVKIAVEVATEEHKAIASFWDCNPFVMNQTGHMMYASKKITPGGHWMGIASIASKKNKSNMLLSVEAAALTSIALFDAFISCWDEKYRSNLIRPETVINEYLDKDWKPILQTPPFPEHTSGHSVASTSAATVLTNLYGDNFAYRDDVELKYGLPVREFSSFLQASGEAAISRLYGGIHYMPAITDGVTQGKAIGEFINGNLSTRIN
ncbi:vanadium-dependent haloperoxidase [Saprospiraceae bacterium]|nr:vanadium-dependent haloperoxidase [Saprospiraceae bacterium]